MEETKQQPLALRVCAELAGSFLLCFAHLRLLHMGFGRVWHQYRVLRVGYRLGICRSHRHLLPRVRWPAESGHHRSLRAGFQDEILDGILYVIAQVIGAIAAASPWSSCCPHPSR